MSAMPAEAEPRRASIALSAATLSPTTVRPRQAGLQAVPAAGQRTLPAAQRPRRAGPRAHPTGVRACSAVLRADPLDAGPVTIPRPVPSLPAEDSRSLRLTTRGRVVLAVCAAVAASLFGFAAASGALAADHGVPSAAAGHSMSRIVVQPGQTLWSIAVQADPQADPRLVIQQIMAVNSLPSGSVTAGQRLLVPRA